MSMWSEVGATALQPPMPCLNRCANPLPEIDRVRAAFLCGITFLAAVSGLSGSVPVRADELAERVRWKPGFRVRAVVIDGADVITQPGERIAKTRVLVRDDQVVAIGDDIKIPPDADVIDGTGCQLSAAWMDSGVTSIVERPVVPAATADTRPEYSRFALAGMVPDHRHGLAPEYVAVEHLNSGIPWEQWRAAGFGAVQAIPSGLILNGQAGLVSTTSGPAATGRVLNPLSAVSLDLSEQRDGEYPATRMGVMAHLRQAWLDAEHDQLRAKLFASGAAAVPRPTFQPAWHALRTHYGPGRLVLIPAQTRDEIHAALSAAREWQLRPVIVGGRESADMLDELQAASAAVVLQVNFGDEPKVEDPVLVPLKAETIDPVRVQGERRRLWQRWVTTPQRLHAAGIPVALTTAGLGQPNELAKSIREMRRLGVDSEVILAALTTAPAKLFADDARYGRVAVGAIASLVLTHGDWSQPEFKVRAVVLDGQVDVIDSNPLPTPPPVVATPALSGRWDFTLQSSSGPVNGSLLLEQNGPALAGRIETASWAGRITGGSLQASALKFTVGIGVGDRQLELQLEGTWESAAADHPERLSGTLKSPLGADGNWSALRPQPNPGVTQVATVTDPAGETVSALKVANLPASIEAPAVAAADGSVQFAGIEAGPAVPSANTLKSPAAAAVSAADTQTRLAEADAAAITAVDAKPAAGELPSELLRDRLPKGPRTGGRLVIRGGTVLNGLGETFPDHDVLMLDGRIVAIGPGLEVPADVPALDARGRYVTPGLIDTHSHMMLQNVNEATHSLVPEVRVQDELRTSDRAEYFWLAGGLTTARLLHGSANTIGGQDAVVQLKVGENAAGHLLPEAHAGVKFALGENVKRRSGRFPNTRLGVEATLNRAFIEAIEYRKQWQDYERARIATPDVLPPRRDLRLEVLVDLLEGRKFVHSHCYRADEILMLLRLAEGFGIRVWSLQHVLEGYKVAPEIARHGASCSTFADLWAFKVEAYDATSFNADLLQLAGCNVVIKSDFPVVPSYLYREAARTLRYGQLTADQVLSMITINPARELGIADHVGSLTPGKRGDVAILTRHPLDGLTRVTHTVIGGEIWFDAFARPTAMTAAQQLRSLGLPAAAGPAADTRVTPPPLPATLLHSGEPPRPVAFPANGYERLALVGGVIHPVDRPDLPRGVLLIEAGRIVAVGEDIEIPAGYQVVDVAGLHVFPGMIDAGSQLGLQEIAAVKETVDFAESGNLQPDLRTGVAINPDSELIPVNRAGGVTTVLIQPTGGLIAGQASVARLAGWTVPEMIREWSAGLQIMWPKGDSKDELQKLKRFLREARVYAKARDAVAAGELADFPIDPRFEALRPYLKREKPVLIEADTRKEIAEALLFAEAENLRIVMTDASEAWKLADELRRRDVPVILGPVVHPPLADHDPYDACFANPGRLYEAGVRFCIRSDTATNSRNVPLDAGFAVAYGLPEEIGLRSVTLSPAEILGLADQLGSLTPGKRADVVIASGSLLQPSTRILGVLIDGEPQDLENRQSRFHAKYRRRLEVNRPPMPSAAPVEESPAAAVEPAPVDAPASGDAVPVEPAGEPVTES